MSSTKLDTRTKILNAAWALLDSDDGTAGGQGVRMADIATAAGISRQAVYLHFPARAELLAETTRHIDEVKDIAARLAPSRAATTGRDRLRRFIDAWGTYIPEIYSVCRAILTMAATDAEAQAAWAARMQDMREGCEAAVQALKKDGDLAAGQSTKQATDILWMMLSIETWEHYRHTCGWSQKRYLDTTQQVAERVLIG